MSLSSQQLRDIENLKEIYDKAVDNKDGQSAMAVINRLKAMGFTHDADQLLAKTRILDLVTPSCKSTWETDDPTQENA